MSDDKHARMSALKDELVRLEAHPWDAIESWIAKATPIIQTDWREHLDAFQNVTAEPQRVRLRPTASEQRDGIMPTPTASQIASNKEKAEAGKRKIAGFLDGLLTTRAVDGTGDTEQIGLAASGALTKRDGYMQRIGAMIGSPSDASEERHAITDTILRWNAVNRDKGIFIEPVKWETHATPGLQGRPQGMINAELIPISWPAPQKLIHVL